MAGADVVKKCDEGYAKLQAAKDCKSLLKKHLTKKVLDENKNKKTKLGATLLDVIQSGVANLDSGVGLYAPDAESYTLFKSLFDPVIQEYHNGFKPTQKQPALDLGETKIATFPDLDPEGAFINSTRIRCGRSLEGYPFNPCLTEPNYIEMEGKMKAIFTNIKEGDFVGNYYPLDGMTKEDQDKLIADHFLFKEGDRFLQTANACRFWPKGRGIFHNTAKTFLVWVNEEDHLRIISMQNGGNVGQVLERLIKGVKQIEAGVPFSRDARLGYLTFCPTNLGTTVRASVHIKLPKISAKPNFKSVTDGLKLQVRGIHGEHSDSAGGVYDVSNKARLGITEYEAVKQMYDGVKKLIEQEKAAVCAEKCEEGYAKLQAAADCKSLLKKHFTKKVLDENKAKKTKLGATLLDVIQSGVANLDSGVGLYAPDAESYTLFKSLFDPVIEEYHNGFKPSQKQPPLDLGEGKIDTLPDLDPEGAFINSTRIRCGRSLQGYPFNPCLSEPNYIEMEGKMKAIFTNIKEGDFVGNYYPLDGMTKEDQDKLIADHFLFKEGDRFLQTANACRFWPKGRGIFHNTAKTFLVWVNEEDHLRIISMQNGGNVGQVLERLIKGVKQIETGVPFSRDPRLGYLTFCPTNLGTTVRASVHIKLPKISAKPDFKTITDSLKLQVRGIHGEHSESAGGVYDVSNKARLGLTEYEAVKQMYDGVKKLIELEKAAA